MSLSGMPSVGPSLPAGCTNVKVKSSATDPSSGSSKVDVTTLSDSARVYADPPLVDAGATASEDGVTQTVVATFFGLPPEPSPPGSFGWVVSEVETEYAVGEFVKGTATYTYIPPPTTSE